MERTHHRFAKLAFGPYWGFAISVVLGHSSGILVRLDFDILRPVGRWNHRCYSVPVEAYMRFYMTGCVIVSSLKTNFGLELNSRAEEGSVDRCYCKGDSEARFAPVQLTQCSMLGKMRLYSLEDQILEYINSFPQSHNQCRRD